MLNERLDRVYDKVDEFLCKLSNEEKLGPMEIEVVLRFWIEKIQQNSIKQYISEVIEQLFPQKETKPGEFYK